MIDYISECVNCETCINCGRESVEVTRCDDCNCICDDGVFREKYGSDDLCRTCARANIVKEIMEMSDEELFDLMDYEEVKI